MRSASWAWLDSTAGHPLPAPEPGRITRRDARRRPAGHARPPPPGRRPPRARPAAARSPAAPHAGRQPAPGSPRATPSRRRRLGDAGAAAVRAGRCVLGLRPARPRRARRSDRRAAPRRRDALGRAERLEPEPPAAPTSPSIRGLVAICLATHEPAPQLLAAQIASLRAQTHEHWVCVVCDDASSPAGLATVRAAIAATRASRCIAGGDRAGAYRTFERCLRHVPPAPRRRSRSATRTTSGIRASSRELLARAGAGRRAEPQRRAARRRAGRDPLADLLDRTAGARRTDIGDLLIANTVTGMASLFRRDLLEAALPFPAPLGPDAYPRPLDGARRGGLRADRLRRPSRSPTTSSTTRTCSATAAARVARSAAPRWERWQDSYCDLLLPRRALAATLLLRCAATMSAAQRRSLERLAAPQLGAARSRAALHGGAARRRTLGHEWRMLRGALWAARARAAAGSPRSRCAATWRT